MKVFLNYDFRPLDYKNLWLTILLYTGLIGVNALLMYLFPVGFSVHDTGSAVAMLFLIMSYLTSILLFIKTLIKTVTKDKRYILSLAVHVIFWISYLTISTLQA